MHNIMFNKMLNYKFTIMILLNYINNIVLTFHEKYLINIIIWKKNQLLKITFFLSNVVIDIHLYLNKHCIYRHIKNIFLMDTYINQYLYSYKSFYFQIKLRHNAYLYQEIMIKRNKYINKYVKLMHQLYKTIYQAKYKFHLITIYKYIVKHLSIPLFYISLFKQPNMIRIYYEYFIYYLNPLIDQKKLFNYIIHSFNIYYQNSSNLNIHALIHRKSVLIIDINIFICKIQKYLLEIKETKNKLYNLFIKTNYNLFINFEYPINILYNKYTYIFIRYLPQNSRNKYIANLAKNVQHTNIGLGIQFYIPVKYIPILRIECIFQIKPHMHLYMCLPHQP